METLLNRGLSFTVLPLKLDLTEVLVDFKRFERSAIWHEFMYGKEKDDNYEAPIFKQHKTNLPKNYTTPKELKTFLGAIKSEILDPRNRNNVKCNLPVKEIAALKELIRLQRERQIMIKPCDKGAGILILYFVVYMKACYEHLLAKHTNKNGEEIKYYEQVDDFQVEKSKNLIRNFLKEALENEIINKDEFKAMDPSDKKLAKYYSIFKVNKPHEENMAPPTRPIISGSGSIIENLGVYVDHHLKEISKRHKSHLQDTPDFLRKIDKLNKGPPLPHNAMLVTIDAIGAYTNIPQEGGTQCLKEALDERIDQNIPSEFIAKMMELVLKHNLFEFNSITWRQLLGTAMGVVPAPDYANIYLAKRIDEQIYLLAQRYTHGEHSSLLLFLRFLDDIISIFIGTTRQLHSFFKEINEIHPTLKFTMSHTSVESETQENKCDCKEQKSIPFFRHVL